MSAGGSMLARIQRTSASRKPRTRGEGGKGHASGINLLAIAEAVLFPDVPARTLTGPQIARAAQMAKAHLVELGQWPASTNDRHDAERISDLRASRRRCS